MDGEVLVCPGCGRTHPGSERFCASCGMPLVQERGAEARASSRQRELRKIKPQYSEGQLVRVVRAANGAEAEFLQGLLREEGIPSLVQRSPGFDVAEFLVAGPRDVLVPESGAEAAREILAPQGQSGDEDEA